MAGNLVFVICGFVGSGEPDWIRISAIAIGQRSLAVAHAGNTTHPICTLEHDIAALWRHASSIRQHLSASISSSEMQMEIRGGFNNICSGAAEDHSAATTA